MAGWAPIPQMRRPRLGEGGPRSWRPGSPGSCTAPGGGHPHREKRHRGPWSLSPPPWTGPLASLSPRSPRCGDGGRGRSRYRPLGLGSRWSPRGTGVAEAWKPRGVRARRRECPARWGPGGAGGDGVVEVGFWRSGSSLFDRQHGVQCPPPGRAVVSSPGCRLLWPLWVASRGLGEGRGEAGPGGAPSATSGHHVRNRWGV